MQTPSISIIVPCYNQAEYLNECLQSVLKQTYQNWECIIVNDGSSDHTEQLAETWLLRDDRFKYIGTINSGVSNARNIGIKESNGEIILPLDADDKIGKAYLEKAIKAFSNNSLLKVVYCYAEKFGDEKGRWNLPDFSLQKLASDNIIFCSALFKKEDWKDVGGYDVTMISGLEDWEFWIALLKNSGDVLRINYVGFYYRIKASSRQADLKYNEKKKIFEYITTKHSDFFVSQKYILATVDKNLKPKQNKNISKKKKAIKKILKTFFWNRFFKF